MRRKILSFVLIFVFTTTLLTGCEEDDTCPLCNGRGYIDYKYCLNCN